MTTPFALLPYQQRWQADPSPVRVAEKSRRIGWSWGAACEATLDAACANGCDTWYVGYNHDMAQEFIRDAAFWARALNTVAVEAGEVMFEDDDPDKQIKAYFIRFASGWRITALSSRPTNLRGKRGHIILDEAAFHDDLPGLIKAALAVLMWGGKARVDIISTHNGTSNDFNKLIEEVRAGKRPYSLHRCTIDEALAQGLYQRICLVNGKTWSPEAEVAWRAELFAQYGDDADEELLCVPARSGGQYLPRGLIERQMRDVPVKRLTLEDGFLHRPETEREAHVRQWLEAELAPLLARLPADRPHVLGEDFGRVSDRTVLTPGTLTQKLVRHVPFVVELCNVPYDQQRQVAFFVLDRLPNLARGAMDATGNGGFLAEACATRYGRVLNPETKELEPKVLPVTMTEKWYAEALPPFKAALEDKLVELARDADHLMDLCAFQTTNGLPKLPKTKMPSKSSGTPRHGDAGMAYALMHFASRLPTPDYAYTPATARAHATRDTFMTPPGPDADNRNGLGRMVARARRGSVL